MKQNGNFSQQKLTIGLDLGNRNRGYCVVEEAGQIQLEQRARTTAKAWQEVFGRDAAQSGCAADGGKAKVATRRQKKTFVSAKVQRIHETRTGLLMEGS